MKTTNSLIFLIGLICLTQTTLSENCLEYLSLFDSRTRMVHCPLVSRVDKRAPASSNNMFNVNFQCLISNKNLCNKVSNVFNTAGNYITATLNLKSTINVNATFTDFCQSFGSCGENTVILGAAKSARLIPYQDPKDSRIRFYPQALYKQLDLPDHLEHDSNDIIAMFNAKMNYWFEGDPMPLSQGQADMLYVVLHELIHGLGFASSWNDYFDLKALTPNIGQSTKSPQSQISQMSNLVSGLTVDGKVQFFEFIFDKFLALLPSGKSLTSVADELNKVQFNGATTDNDVVNAFKSSSQFATAQNMYNQAMTPNTFGFLTDPNLQFNSQLNSKEQILNSYVVLETSLNPFQPASSIGHVDLRTYLNTSDFLMIYTYPRETLDQMMSKAGSTTKTGPIGPKLRLVLERLGYDVKKDYTPPRSDSSLISFNLVLSLGCVLLNLIYNIYF